MNLVMTLLVRDEEDIIEWNLKYHLSRGVDHFIVTDNLSTDGTTEILRRYEREGILTYLHQRAPDYSQDLWVTQMAEIAQSRRRPDWVIHCDADEFWWPHDFTDLKGALSSVRSDLRVVEVPRHNFLGAADGPVGPFFNRMVSRQRRSVNFLGEPLPPKIAHRPLEAPYVHAGNHRVSEHGRVLPARTLEGVSIFHFPARTPDQLRRKIASAAAAYRPDSPSLHNVGETWRAMHREILAGRFTSVVESSFVTSERHAGVDLVEDHRLRDYLSAL